MKVIYKNVCGNLVHIPAEALKTYQAKCAAVRFLQANGSIYALSSTPGVDKARRTIRNANLRIRREGWYSEPVRS